MKSLSKFLVLIGVIILMQIAHAEGGSCPDGYYPIGGQGSSGCAPMPYNQQSQPQQPPPRPVKWADRWGTVAMGWHSNNVSILGKSSNMSSKAEAETVAMNDCKLQGGGKTCHISITYHNQCVAIAWGTTTGNSGVGDPDLNNAKIRAVQGCTAAGGKDCEVIYSNCSMAIQIQ